MGAPGRDTSTSTCNYARAHVTSHFMLYAHMRAARQRASAIFIFIIALFTGTPTCLIRYAGLSLFVVIFAVIAESLSFAVAYIEREISTQC